MIAEALYNDPGLSSILTDELVLLNDLKFWRFAFIVISILFFGVMSIFYQIDFMYAALTSIIIGAGSKNAAFLYYDRG